MVYNNLDLVYDRKEVIFMQRKIYKDMLSDSYVIHIRDYKQLDEIIYLPLYMTPLL